jgi:hypothetical protein
MLDDYLVVWMADSKAEKLAAMLAENLVGK